MVAWGSWLLLLNCSPATPQPVDPARKPADFWPDESEGFMDVCAKACRVLWQYDCPEAKPAKATMNCTKLCRDRPQLFQADCVSRVATKAELTSCDVRCLPTDASLEGR